MSDATSDKKEAAALLAAHIERFIENNFPERCGWKLLYEQTNEPQEN